MTTTVDTDDMLLIHRVIRREVGRLPALIRGAAGDRSRARLVGAHAREMLDFLHTHHHGEDELLYPLLRARSAPAGDLLDRMDEQHAEVGAAVEEVGALLPSWESSADPQVGERMAARLDGILPGLIEHLAEEEAQLLPLVSVTVTQAEWDQLGKHGLGAIPGKRRLVILGHIVEETTEEERARFLLNVPPPARLAYRLLGRRQHARETAAIRG
jgi:hemerythrin-like domain-containing protein